MIPSPDIPSCPESFHDCSLGDLQTYSSSLLSFLAESASLYRYDYSTTYVNAFLLHSHWSQRVPSLWHDSLLQLSCEQLVRLARGTETDEWLSSLPPLEPSLLSFIHRSRALRIPTSFDVNENSLPPYQLTYPFTLRMKRKKIHEIERLVSLVLSMIPPSDDSVSPLALIDLGCGQGYLTSALAFELDSREHIKVIGVDSDPRQTDGFRSRCNGLAERKDIRKNEGLRDRVRCSDVDLYVRDMLQVFSEEVLEWTSPREEHDEEEGERDMPDSDIMILALHGCGDLTPASLRLYSDLVARSNGSNRQITLLNVSCCYFKLTRSPQNFPMSSSVSSSPHLLSIFGPETPEDQSDPDKAKGTPELALGCFAVQTWGPDPRNSIEKFRLRSFRFAFEAWLCGRSGDETPRVRFNGRNVPRRAVDSFSEYVRWALEKIGLESFDDDEQLREWMETDDFETDLESFYQTWGPDETGVVKTVAAFWALRGLVAPLMEALVVIDRVLYLREVGSESVRVCRVFREDVSPRSFVLISKNSRN